MRPCFAILACAILLALPLRAQETDEAQDDEPKAAENAPAEAAEAAEPAVAGPASKARPAFHGTPARAQVSSPSSGGGSAAETLPAPAPEPAAQGAGGEPRAPSGGMRSIGGGQRALGAGTGRAMTGNLRGIGVPSSGGGGGGSAFTGANALSSPDPSRRRPGSASYKALGQLSGVNRVVKGAASAGGEDGTAMNSRAWDGGKARSVGVAGPDGGGGGGGKAQPTEWKPGAGPDSEFGPIFGEGAEETASPPATNVTPWQGLLDKAQLLLKRAGQLLSVSSLTVFIGKQLARTGFGGAFGAGMIAAGTAMAAVAAGLAAAATALGSIILLKYKQKLQGAVLTVSALALTISAVRAAQGNRDAYEKYKNAEERAITEGLRKTQYGMGFSSVFLNREGLNAIKTAANFAIGDTKAGSYMNAAFGVYDGVSGLTGGGGAKAGIQGAIGLAQTWQGLAPTKGQTGEILRTALTGAQTATDMWPTDNKGAKAAEAQARADEKARIDARAAEAKAPPQTPVLASRPIGDGTAALAPDVKPANAEALAAAREQMRVESQIRADAADYAAKNNITDPKAIESIVQSSLKSRAEYDAAHPGALEPTASVTTSEGPIRIKTDSPEYMSAVPPAADKINPVFNNPAVTSKYSELRSVTTSDGSTQVIGRDPNGGWSSWDANGKFTGQLTNAQASGLLSSNPSTRTDLSAQNAAAAQKREMDLGMQQAIADAQAAGVMDAQGRAIIRPAQTAAPEKTQSDLAPGTLQYNTAVALKGQAYVDSLGRYVPPKDNIAEWQKSALDGVGSCSGVIGCTGAHLNSMAAEGTNLGRTMVTGMVAPMVGVATGISIDAAIKNPSAENLQTLAMGTPGVNLVAGEVLGLAGLARGSARLVPDLINNDPRSQQDLVDVSGGLLALIPFAGGRNITAPKPGEAGFTAAETAPVAGVPEKVVRTDVPEIVVAKPGAAPEAPVVNTIRGKSGEPVVVRGDVKIVSPDVVSIPSEQGPRDIIVVQTENGPQPMYRSTGQNSGKAGEWLPFDGAREHAIAYEPDGWFDKNAYAGSGKSDPLARYGTPELQKISQDLGRMNIPEGRTVTSAGANDAIVNAGGELGDAVRLSQDLAISEGKRTAPSARAPQAAPVAERPAAPAAPPADPAPVPAEAASDPNFLAGGAGGLAAANGPKALAPPPPPDPPTKLSTQEMTDRVIDQYGLRENAQGRPAALKMVIDARGDELGATPAQSAAARAELSKLFDVPVTDPHDMRLARLDHVLNVRSATETDGSVFSMATSPDDPWYVKSGAALRRMPGAAGTMVNTVLYDTSKLIDVNTGLNTGSLGGQNFHSPDTSPPDIYNTMNALWAAAKSPFLSEYPAAAPPPPPGAAQPPAARPAPAAAEPPPKPTIGDAMTAAPELAQHDARLNSVLNASKNESIALLPSRVLDALLIPSAAAPAPDASVPEAPKPAAAPAIPEAKLADTDLSRIGTSVPAPTAPAELAPLPSRPLGAGAAAAPTLAASAAPAAAPAAAPSAPPGNPAYENAKAVLVAKGRDPVLIDQAISESVKQGVDPLLALSVIDSESKFNPNATSYKTELVAKKGEIIPGTNQVAAANKYDYSRDSQGNKIPLARGVMQITDPTASWLGVQNPSTELYNPQTNLQAGIGYLKTLTDKYGTTVGVAAYNAGPGAVQKYNNTVPPYKETQSYVTNVLETQALLQAGVVVAKVPVAAKSRTAPAPHRKPGG